MATPVSSAALTAFNVTAVITVPKCGKDGMGNRRKLGPGLEKMSRQHLADERKHLCEVAVILLKNWVMWTG